MSKGAGILLAVLCIAALLVALYCLIVVTKDNKEKDVQYVMYLGTNDKDTNEPVYDPEKSKEVAKDILIRHLGGYTIQEANGGWIDGGTIYQEYTLVIYISDTDLASVHAAADELIEAFHQSSVLIQANTTETDFYAG